MIRRGGPNVAEQGEALDDSPQRPGPSRGSAITEPLPAPVGSGAGRVVTGLLGTATAGLGGLAVCRLVGLDWFTPLAQLISFTPYLVPGGLLVALMCAVARRWRIAVAAGLVVLVLTAVTAPRAIGDDSPGPAVGIPLRVMTVNVYHGGSAGPLMALVRAERPDVLSLQEVTAEALAELEAAGMAGLLPYSAARPQPGVAGTALYGHAPLTGLRTLDSRTRFDMARVRTVHKGVTLDLVAVHPSPPIPAGGATAAWHRELGWLPAPDLGDEAVTVLAGDFNATLDHSGFRKLIGDGYVDAADAVGTGLTPTWQAGWAPPVVIDHVLVERGVGVRAVRVHPVPGSDHRAVVADLTLPEG